MDNTDNSENCAYIAVGIETENGYEELGEITVPDRDVFTRALVGGVMVSSFQGEARSLTFPGGLSIRLCQDSEGS